MEGVAGKLCSKVCSNVYYIHLREERVLSIDLAIEEEIEARADGAFATEEVASFEFAQPTKPI